MPPAIADSPSSIPSSPISSSYNDSEVIYPAVFEGPEKLLEVWLFASPHPERSLKNIPRNIWDGICDVAGCKILSTIQSPDLDAYVLSESSLFVFHHKVIMKTCGTTALLSALPRLLDLAVEYLDFDPGFQPYRVFYSRKNYFFPERQPQVHQTWRNECDVLDFHLSGGSAYTLGRTNFDHWHLYFTEPLYIPSAMEVVKSADQTIEIMMTNLCPIASRVWYLDLEDAVLQMNVDKGHALGTTVAEKSGLTSLFPGTTVDAYAFDPCGFSCNAVIVGTQYYFTVHVTPEPGFSYASFETNIPLSYEYKVLSNMIQAVVDIFKPGKACVSCFDDINNQHLSPRGKQDVLGYRRTEQCVLQLSDYDMTFRSYSHVEST